MMPSSVRLRVTALATLVVAVVLVLLAVVVARLAENEARSVANNELQAALEKMAAERTGDSTQLVVDTQFSVIVDGQVYELGIFDEMSEGDARGDLSIDGVPTVRLELDLRTERVVGLIDLETGQASDDAVLLERLQRLTFDVMDIDGTEGSSVLVGATPATEVDVSVAAIWSALALTLPPLLLVFALIVWFVVGRALRPVQAITDRVDGISTASLDHRVPVPDGDDEVSRLAAVMNRMLERLEDGDRKQRQFSADASHELQSPVATVRMAAELIQRRPIAEKVEVWAGQIVSETDRMVDLIADLLVLSRASDAAISGGRERSSIRDLLAVLDTQNTVGAENRAGIEVQVALPAEELAVECDPADLMRAIQNLCANAVRHAESTVFVSALSEGSQVVVNVEDDGSGINPEDRDRVFERFVRLDSARSRDAGGYGLGLAIVQAVARRNGGSVIIDSSPSLGGARFRFRLPSVGGNR